MTSEQAAELLSRVTDLQQAAHALFLAVCCCVFYLAVKTLCRGGG
jgi:hypothetical protein